MNTQMPAATRIAADLKAQMPADRSAGIRTDDPRKSAPLLSGHPRWDQRKSAWWISGNSRQGQAIVEYAILLGLVVAAIFGIQIYAKRALQAGVKMAADSLSPVAGDTKGVQAQIEGMRYESGDRQLAVVASGTVLERKSGTRSTSGKTTTIDTTPGGGVATGIVTDTAQTSGTLTAIGPGVSSYSRVVVDVE